MKDWNFGYFGKGIDGYVHYTQAFNRNFPQCSRQSEAKRVEQMLCQCVRHEVYEQTKTVRELLVARAMASTVIEQPDTASYEEVEQQPLESENQILKDWFDLHDDSQTE